MVFRHWRVEMGRRDAGLGLKSGGLCGTAKLFRSDDGSMDGILIETTSGIDKEGGKPS